MGNQALHYGIATENFVKYSEKHHGDQHAGITHRIQFNLSKCVLNQFLYN